MAAKKKSRSEAVLSKLRTSVTRPRVAELPHQTFQKPLERKGKPGQHAASASLARKQLRGLEAAHASIPEGPKRTASTMAIINKGDELDRHRKQVHKARAKAAAAHGGVTGAGMKAAPRASPHTLQKGKKGGTFYIANNGKKVYAKK